MAHHLVEQLIENITSNDIGNMSTDFENIYMKLLEQGETAIMPLLLSLQSDDHTYHHTIASILCDILVDVNDDNALELLQQLVYHENKQIFTPAVRAIARLKLPQINEVLCDLLDHPAVQVRRVVAWQLGRNQAVEAKTALSQHLDEIDLETLRGVIWSLGRVGDDQSLHLIEPFTYHLSDDIAFIAQEAVQHIGSKVFNA